MRCLYLLKSMDRTEYQLRTKLKQNFYPEELIDRVILWLLENLHYLDDVRYAESYIRTHGESLSTLQLKQKLTQRGVPRDVIQEALETRRDRTRRDFDPQVGEEEKNRPLRLHSGRKTEALRLPDAEGIFLLRRAKSPSKRQ